MMRILLAFLIALCVAKGGQATAQSVPNSFWSSGALPSLDRGGDLSTEETQFLLLWIGFYYGDIDGEPGSETREAIERFQESLGANASGRLTRSQEKILRSRGLRARDNAGFKTVEDQWTGIRVALPLGYLAEPEIDQADGKFHVHYFPEGSTTLGVRLSRHMISGSAKNALKALKGAVEKIEGAEILGENVEGNFLRLVMRHKGRITLYVYEAGRELRGVKISFAADRSQFFSPIYRQIIAELSPFSGGGLSEKTIDDRLKSGRYPRRQSLPDQLVTLKGTGSGSVVSYDGHILTNHHVVSGCKRLTVNNGNPAVLLGVDIVMDLALVRSERYADRTPIRFRDGEADLGEDVLVMGYPVFSKSQSLNVTEGIVSSLKGLYDDRTRIQISAPVQPGNSGGPVLDLSGHQVAVVVTKASTAFRLESSVENMAWVIRSSVAQEFLKSLGVKPLLAKDEPGQGNARRVVESARSATVRVECHVQ